jgi:rod shape-determining protein MreD
LALFALWCFVLCASALSGLWPDVLALRAYPPDPWVLLTAYLALRGRGFKAVGWAVALGAVRDALSLDPLGTHAFVLGAVAFAFCEGRRHRTPAQGPVRLLATFGAVLVAGWLYLLRVLPMGNVHLSAADVFGVVPTAFWTTLIAAGVYPILDHFRVFDDLMGRPRGIPA